MILVAIAVGLALFCAYEAGAFFERLKWERRMNTIHMRVDEFVHVLDDELAGGRDAAANRN